MPLLRYLYAQLRKRTSDESQPGHATTLSAAMLTGKGVNDKVIAAVASTADTGHTLGLESG